VNAAAPQAPVAESGKNRKPRHGGKPAGLERGPGKGSAAFQQLLAARAARTAAALAAGRAHEAEGSIAAEAAGLKKALLALLKRQSAAHPLPGAAPEGESGSVAGKAHEDSAKKSAHAKALAGQAAAVLAAFGRAEAQPGAGSAAALTKERKGAAAELDKAPVGESRPAAHRAEPPVRIVDLRRHEKPAASVDTVADRKTEQSPAADRDPSGGITRFGPSRETFVETAARPAPAPAASSQTPTERLREMAGTELVRASTMVLRDGGGEIRLVLKPESLGSVRVRMNLVDNHIEGRIIVDSAAVKHVFDGSVDALRRALTAEGFQMGSLQVSVGGQDAQPDQGRQDRQPPEAVRRVTAQGFERNVPGAEDVSLGDLFVNLFA